MTTEEIALSDAILRARELVEERRTDGRYDEFYDGAVLLVCDALEAVPSHEHPIRDRGEPKPIGYARSVDVDPAERPFEGRTSFWCHERQNAYYSVPVYFASLPPARVEEEPRVKALEWRELTSPREDGPPEPIGEWEADCVIGTYIIKEDGGEWWLLLADLFDVRQVGRSDDPDRLRGIAQADYAARIIGVLE